MKQFLQREPVRRALRTFIQTAAGYIAANIAAAILDAENNKAVIAVITTGIAAGIAAAMNIERNDNQDGGADE